MNIDTNLNVRQYFYDLSHDLKKVAKSKASSIVESLNLWILEPTERVVRISEEMDLVKKKMDTFVRKEYLNSTDDDQLLFNYFSGHLYFCQEQEEEKLLEGWVLSETYHLLSQLRLQTMAQLPLFAPANFMNNDKNFVFFVLNQQPFGTSDADYADMRYWQAHMKSECVNQESSLLKGRFIENVIEIPGNRNLVQAEIDQVDFLLGNGHQLTPKQCCAHLLKLRAFSPGSMPKNVKQWHESFCQFLKGKAMPYALCPAALLLALSNIQAGIISNAPICCWSLMRYKKWLNDILEGKIDLKEVPELSVEMLVEKIKEAGLERGKATIVEIKINKSANAWNTAKYQSYIFKAMNKLRYEFNTIAYPDYYRLIPEPEMLKSCFINNCLAGHEIEKHQKELENAFFLDQMIRFFEEELIRMDPTLIRTSFDLDSLNYAIHDLISVMVPNAYLINQLKKAVDQAKESLKNRIPILFIEENLIDLFVNIFHQATRHLQHIFDYQPTDLKAIYAACQIRNLDYLQVNAQRNGQALNLCIDNLRKIFHSEMKYKKNQDKYKQMSVENLKVKETEAPEMEVLSFGCKKSTGFLTLIIHALNNRINFLDVRTTVEDCIRIMTSKNLGEIKEKIYLACQTNEFKYIRERLAPFFKSFNPATIGKSGIFISNLGTPITAQSLYSSLSENLQNKIAIDAIFNQKH